MGDVSNTQLSATRNRLQRIAGILVGGILALTVTSSTAFADTLHGFCWGTSTCADNGTNTPTTSNPPQFGFVESGKGGTAGVYFIDFLVPDNVTGPASIAITGDAPGTATRFSSTPWTSGQLDAYLGISASPTNPIGAFGGAPGYFVYQADLGTQTLGGTANEPSGPLESLTSGLPKGTYILAFLNTGAAAPDFSATANSGAILLTNDPTPPSVPEPGSLLLVCTGLMGAAVGVRRRFSR